ncbi:unnamed protein product, partial [Allacma fusca]
IQIWHTSNPGNAQKI